MDPNVDARFSAIERRLDKLDGGTTTIPAPPNPHLSLASWKLTTPILEKSGKIREVRQPQLDGYSDAYFSRTPDGGLRFRVYHGGVTTSGSPNPRCELREMNADGSDEVFWSTTKGRHSLTVRHALSRLTRVRPHLVVAQIHGGDDDVTVFRVEGTKLWITKGDDTHSYLVSSALPAEFAVGFDVSDGVVRYRFNGAQLAYSLKVKDSGCYFKAGAYLQSNPKSAPSESTASFAETIIRELRVTHS